MLLATPVLSDAAVLSGSAASGVLGVSNLKTINLQEVFRAADASAVYIVADLGSAKSINLVSLIGHTGSSRSFARVRAAATEENLTIAPGFDSGNLPFRSHQSGYDATWAATAGDETTGAMDRNMFMDFFPEQNFRFWRIDIADPNSVYLDIGRLYISKAWQPRINMDYGLSEGWVDPSRKTRTWTGRVIGFKRKKYRFAEFTLSFGGEEEMFDNAQEIDRLRGITDDVLFIQDPDATKQLQRRSIYGTMAGLSPIVNSAFRLFQKTYRIEEIPA